MLCLQASCGPPRQSLTSQHSIILCFQLYPLIFKWRTSSKKLLLPLLSLLLLFRASIYRFYSKLTFCLCLDCRNRDEIAFGYTQVNVSWSFQLAVHLSLLNLFPLSCRSPLSPSVNLPVLQSPLLLLSKTLCLPRLVFCESIVGSQWVYGGSRSAWKHKRGGGSAWSQPSVTDTITPAAEAPMC